MTLEELAEERLGESALPLVVRPLRDGVALADLYRDRRAWFEERLIEFGAVLFRGFGIGDATDFTTVADLMVGERLPYMYRSTPRTAVGARVYTTTEYPAQSPIPLHNENAYQHDWPMRLAFCCLLPAARGGETPIASTLAVTRRIPSRIVARFRESGVRYIRNYYDFLDLPWQTVFQTDDPEVMADYCRTHRIEFEWKPDGNLRTWQTAQAIARHPATGDEVWFNQAHLFHPSALDAATRGAMSEMFAEEDLPRNAVYGDGSPIEEEDLALIRQAYEDEATLFEWQAGDVLLLDNMLVSHGRSPYRGERRVLAALGDAWSRRTAR